MSRKMYLILFQSNIKIRIIYDESLFAVFFDRPVYFIKQISIGYTVVELSKTFCTIFIMIKRKRNMKTIYHSYPSILTPFLWDSYC